MDISLENSIVSRKSAAGVLRDSRHFAPDGFDEQIWILFEGDEVGEELFDELCEHVFSHVYENEDEKALSSVERFERAMKELNEKLVNHAHIPDDFLKKNSFILLLSIENQIHFTVVGNGEVYFIRSGKLFHASEGIAAQNVEDDLFLNIASGEIQDSDVLFISTLRLLRYVSNAQMLDISKYSAKEASHTLEEFINSDEGGVFGVIRVDGAPALPFEKPHTHITSQSKGGFSFHSVSLPPAIERLVEKLPIHSNKKEFLFLGIGVVALLILWSFISLLSGGMSGETKKSKDILVSVEATIDEAQSYIAEKNTEDAYRSLDSAEDMAFEILNSNSPFRLDAQKSIEQIHSIRDELSGTLRISGSSLVDVGEEKPNTILKGLFLFDEEIFVFDSSSLMRIVGNAVENIIDLKDGETVIAGVPLENKDLKVFLTDSGKIIELNGNTASFAKTDDPLSWKKAVDIGFYNKNIYLLSPENNDIYKYVRKNDTYSSPIAYNKDGNLKNAISLAIDGSIFALLEGGKVVKMHSGETVPFELIDKPKGFENVDVIYTLIDLDLLIFMSKMDKRIYIFRKGEEGATFDRQIFLDVDASSLSGLWFDFGANRILVSGDDKIYVVPLTK